VIEKSSWLSFPLKLSNKKGNPMTTSSLYHTQGIRGYKYQKTQRTKDTEIYSLHSTASHLACPACQSKDTSIVQTGKTRDIRGLSIGLKKR
jgi:hypothetical protein